MSNPPTKSRLLRYFTVNLATLTFGLGSSAALAQEPACICARDVPGTLLGVGFSSAFTYAPGGNDRFRVTISDGASRGVAADQMLVLLRTSRNMWRKEISAWSFCEGHSTTIATDGPNRGAVGMMIQRGQCGGGDSDNIILRKAGLFGVMYDAYHFQFERFWPTWAGKVVTFTWLSD